MIIVGKNEKYKTINEALNAITEESEDKTILVKNGIYFEKIIINISSLTLLGESQEFTIITNSDYARKLDDNGKPLGTFKSFTMLILKPNVTILNLTIRNDSGIGERVGQAVALFSNADQVNVQHCSIISSQDTLLTGPIPFDAKNQEDLDFSIDHFALYHQVYNNCFIQGDVDFIFGSANALFKNCTIKSNNLNKDINGYISAASTELNHNGHVFFECDLISDSKEESVYLGRPWREHANSVFINCFMGSHIHREAFAKWDQKHLKSRYFEYGSYGPGAYRGDKSIIKKIDETELIKYINLFSL